MISWLNIDSSLHTYRVMEENIVLSVKCKIVTVFYQILISCLNMQVQQWISSPEPLILSKKSSFWVKAFDNRINHRINQSITRPYCMREHSIESLYLKMLWYRILSIMVMMKFHCCLGGKIINSIYLNVLNSSSVLSHQFW